MCSGKYDTKDSQHLKKLLEAHVVDGSMECLYNDTMPDVSRDQILLSGCHAERHASCDGPSLAGAAASRT